MDNFTPIQLAPNPSSDHRASDIIREICTRMLIAGSLIAGLAACDAGPAGETDGDSPRVQAKAEPTAAPGGESHADLDLQMQAYRVTRQRDGAGARTQLATEAHPDPKSALMVCTITDEVVVALCADRNPMRRPCDALFARGCADLQGELRSARRPTTIEAAVRPCHSDAVDTSECRPELGHRCSELDDEFVCWTFGR